MVLSAKTVVPRLAVTIGLLVGHFYSVAFAFEGDLILPIQGKSNVVFEMRNEQEDIDPSEVFQVFVGKRDVCCEGKSAIAGRYTMDNRTVTFDPAFDFIEGQNYTVKISDQKSATNRNALLFNEFTIKRTSDHVSPEIVAIYPSGTDIPENTLRFYIHFSTAMRPHVSGEYIKLLDATGTPDTAAFMAFKQELWSADRKRLTLLMDPGRIKRGVAQNLSLGPALLEGSTYSIVVEDGWPAANGVDKITRSETVFTVSKALRTLPNPDLWTILSPQKMTNDSLVIEFDRAFDSELLLSAINVLDEDGHPIQGVVSIEDQERVWRFDRIGAWDGSRIQLAIDPQLEDVAGNNLIELLDHPVDTEVSAKNPNIFTLYLEPSPL